MENWIISILNILGSLLLFIYGMKVMSDGIQQAAGSQIRYFLTKLMKNRFVGLFTGLFTTGIVQSSSATTVMTVSFVNAGLLTLRQSVGLIIGANVGTTITAWIIVIGGFLFDFSKISLPLLVIAIPMLLRGRTKIRYWGEFLIGFSLLFIGLNFIKESFPSITDNQALLESFSAYTNYGFFSLVLFVFIGAIITMLIQSSSAAMALTLTMCINGWLPLELGAAMVLGENIGTTITAEIAALVGNIHAKRSARIHSLFCL